MYGGHLCIVVLLGTLRQRVEAEVDPRLLVAALGTASLYENVRILLLCARECVCMSSISVRKSPVVNAIVRV